MASSGSADRTAATTSEVEGDETLSTGGAARGEPGHQHAAYRLGELLGRGGMGDVYSAYEPRLERRIALKLLRGDDPDQIRRFLREARAQAGIVHDNVCRVYGTGELGGRPYIAMQHIEGDPLFETRDGAGRPSAALMEMTLEQKLQVMEKVADGIHAAHRCGVIHRDIKPSNVMVERLEDGSWKPYVLDFGLARQASSAAVTSLGMAVGTPHFMAPEQVRGETGALDRRTDVYGLGATLYALLAGRPPFEAPSSLDVMVKVNEGEAPPLREVPPDVATIVGKCLEKDPGRRYDSARALSEDLRRYLDGDPVLARPAGLASRLWKKAKKNRTLTAVSSAALLAVTTLGTLSVRAELRGRQMSRLARELGQQVTGIENLMRIGQLLPRHDITADKQRIRERMAALVARVEELGSVAEGPGAYALGRGYLALGEPAAARGSLESAWRAGYREPVVAYALGVALGELYDEELRAVERIRDEARREPRRREIVTALRDPALAYLRRGESVETESPAYAEALVAFYEERFEEALEKAAVALAGSPWLYEARTLEGEALARLAGRLWSAGKSEAAFSKIAEAKVALRAATAIGRSDPRPYQGLCRLTVQVMEMTLYGSGGDLGAIFEEGKESCRLALEVDPRSPTPLRSLASLHFRQGESDLRRGRDAAVPLRSAIEVAGRAAELDPKDPEVFIVAGNAHLALGHYEGRLGDDPTPALAAAARAFERALELDPDHGIALNSSANVYISEAYYKLSRGEDPRPQVASAVAVLERAAASPTSRHNAWQNTGLALSAAARYELARGLDPTPTVERGVGHAERVAEASPEAWFAHYVLVELWQVQAEYEVDANLDPTASLAAARRGLRRIAEINPEAYFVGEYRGRLEVVAAEWQLDHGESPGGALAEARAALAAALEGGGNTTGIRVSQGEAAAVEARWRAARGESPERPIAEGLRQLEEGRRQKADDAGLYAVAAELHYLRALWASRAGDSAPEDVERGLELVEAALAINPNAAESLALRGALYLLRHREAAIRRAGDLAAARADLERALSLNPRLERRYAGLAHEAAG